MISLNTNIQLNNTPNFTSHSAKLKKTYDICRRTREEFPLIYSNTKLYGYNSLEKKSSFSELVNFSEHLLYNYRKYYQLPINEEWKKLKVITGLKKFHVGNCGEVADITKLALELNGYKNVKILNLYAYNPKTKKMRDLDHTVTGVDFELPKDYQYTLSVGSLTEVNPKHRIYPNNKSIIVDSWSGFAEYGKNVQHIYSSSPRFIKGTWQQMEKLKSDDKLLEEGEHLCFVPYPDSLFSSASSIKLESYGKRFPNLILNENKKDLSQFEDLPKVSCLSAEGVKNLKEQYLPSAQKTSDIKEISPKTINLKTKVVNFIKNII